MKIPSGLQKLRLEISLGGYSAYSDATSIAYEDELAWTTEVGLNLQPKENLRMVVTAFWSEIEDYQFEKLFLSA